MILIDIDKLINDSYLDVNVDNKAIERAARFIQDSIVERIIGDCFFQRLIIDKQTCTNEYKWLIDGYIYPIFEYGIPSELGLPLTYKIRNSGEVKLLSDNFEVGKLEDVNFVAGWYRSRMDFYIERLTKYFLCNKQIFDNCPTCGGCGCKNVPILRNRFTSPLVL